MTLLDETTIYNKKKKLKIINYTFELLHYIFLITVNTYLVRSKMWLDVYETAMRVIIQFNGRLALPLIELAAILR